MSGAYTAKPDADTTPDVPPGWNPNWPFDPYPGVYPPGYEPEFSLVMTAPEEIVYDDSASVTGSLRDHATYATREPTDTAILWTAMIDGVAVNLRFSGDPSYVSSISSVCAFATYWEAAPTIEFELTGGNAGDTIVLTGTSVIDGEIVTETSSIAIAITVRFFGFFELNDFGPAVGATVSIEIEGVEVASTTTSATGYYSMIIPLSEWGDPGDDTDLMFFRSTPGGDQSDDWSISDPTTSGDEYDIGTKYLNPLCTAIITVTVNGSFVGAVPATVDAYLFRVASSIAQVRETNPGGSYVVTDKNPADGLTVVDEGGGAFSITTTTFAQWQVFWFQNLRLRAKASSWPIGGCTVTGSFAFSREGVLVDTYVASITDRDSGSYTEDWLYCDGSTVTEL